MKETEDRKQRTEVRKQKTEVRSQRSETKFVSAIIFSICVLLLFPNLSFSEEAMETCGAKCHLNLDFQNFSGYDWSISNFE